MSTAFDGEIDVHYRYLLVLDEEEFDLPEPGAAICDSPEPGTLSFVTGLHTGRVPITVQTLDSEPGLDDLWEDVFETSVEFATTALQMVAFEDSCSFAVPSIGTYRVRFSASGMDAAEEADTRLAGEAPLDRYLLQLWPAPAAPNAVVRRTSEFAKNWDE